jgi:ketosteroid isomerase-like protein
VSSGALDEKRLRRLCMESATSAEILFEAMSQEKVELLRQGFAEFARGEVDALLERFDPDIDWHAALAPILGVDAIHGREAMREFLTRDLLEEGFDEFRAEPLAYEDLGGEHVLVMTRYVVRGESSGIEMDQRYATLYEFRGEKVVTMRDYPTRADALETVGLSE